MPPIPWSRFISHRKVLRILQTGFALVLLLLGTACVIAVRGTRAIQKHAEAVLREELTSRACSMKSRLRKPRWLSFCIV